MRGKPCSFPYEFIHIEAETIQQFMNFFASKRILPINHINTLWRFSFPKLKFENYKIYIDLFVSLGKCIDFLEGFSERKYFFDIHKDDFIKCISKLFENFKKAPGMSIDAKIDLIAQVSEGDDFKNSCLVEVAKNFLSEIKLDAAVHRSYMDKLDKLEKLDKSCFSEQSTQEDLSNWDIEQDQSPSDLSGKLFQPVKLSRSNASLDLSGQDNPCNLNTFFEK